jgi:hypothetical protein
MHYYPVFCSYNEISKSQYFMKERGLFSMVLEDERPGTMTLALVRSPGLYHMTDSIMVGKTGRGRGQSTRQTEAEG